MSLVTEAISSHKTHRRYVWIYAPCHLYLFPDVIEHFRFPTLAELVRHYNAWHWRAFRLHDHSCVREIGEQKTLWCSYFDEKRRRRHHAMVIVATFSSMLAIYLTMLYRHQPYIIWLAALSKSKCEGSDTRWAENAGTNSSSKFTIFIFARHYARRAPTALLK